MATEMLMQDVTLCVQGVLAGATDLMRANARGGTTAPLKLAHFAELYGASVELNGPAGWAVIAACNEVARLPTPSSTSASRASRR